MPTWLEHLSASLKAGWDFVGSSSDQITAVAAAAAAFFAYRGLRSWQHQMKGTAEYRLAKELMKAVYRVREAFMHVRNPAIFSYEYPQEMLDTWGYPSSALQAEATEYVYNNRWKRLHEAFVTLEEKNLDAQVEWGSQYSEVIKPLRKCRVELQLAIRDIVDGLKPNAKPSTEAAKERDAKSVIYHIDPDSPDDRFTPEIEEAIRQFENRLRPKNRHVALVLSHTADRSHSRTQGGDSCTRI